MNIEIIRTTIQFKNPIIGKPTYSIPDHYYARRIFATVDGEKEQLFRFMADEMPFEADEFDMIAAIETRLAGEQGIEANPN